LGFIAALLRRGGLLSRLYHRFRIRNLWYVHSMTDSTVIEQEQEESEQVEPQWERAECTCPDWCERDHELD
jgi:hypothetical protein